MSDTRCPICPRTVRGQRGLISHLCTVHQDCEVLAPLASGLQFPFCCTLCHARITEIKGYLQHFADRHPIEFAEIHLFPDVKTPLDLPDTITPLTWPGDRVYSPSARLYNFGGISRNVTVLKPTSPSFESDLNGLASRNSNLFVKPILSEMPGTFVTPAALDMLMIGSDGGLIVVDLLSGNNHPTSVWSDFFANRNVLLHATPEEKRRLNASNIQFISNVPSSKLGGMNFLNACDDILRKLHPLNSLMNLKVDPIRKFPTSLVSFLSAISYEILLLFYLERTGFITPSPEPGSQVHQKVQGPEQRSQIVDFFRSFLPDEIRVPPGAYPDDVF